MISKTTNFYSAHRAVLDPHGVGDQSQTSWKPSDVTVPKRRFVAGATAFGGGGAADRGEPSCL
jgi:hypothetical protein